MLLKKKSKTFNNHYKKSKPVIFFIDKINELYLKRNRIISFINNLNLR